MTHAIIGYDSAIGKATTPMGSTFSNFAEVTAIGSMDFQRGFVEATHLKSPDAYKEYILSLFDTGPVQVTLNYLPSATDAVMEAFHGVPDNYQITAPNGVMLRFTGAIETYSILGVTAEGKMEATITIRRTSGKPTLHPAAA